MSYTVQDVLNGTVRGRTAVVCPFHDDDYPSATMYEDMVFRCHGCGAVYSLRPLVARLIFGSDGHEAMALAGALIAEGGLGELRNVPSDDQLIRRPDPSTMTYRLLTTFWEHARNALAANPAMIAELQRTRGIHDPVAMGLGLVDSQIPMKIVDSLQGVAPQEDIEESLMEAGICYRLKPGIHDLRPVPERFRLSRHHLIITDWYNQGAARKVVFYQARATAETPVKYLCPPDFPKPLFGLHSLALAAPHIWLCEGPFDILPLIEAGQSAVAVTGSDLKPSHVQDLTAAANDREILIAFDRDASGQKKAPGILTTLQSNGLKARIIVPPPPYKDMGEWATAEGVDSILADVEWG